MEQTISIKQTDLSQEQTWKGRWWLPSDAESIHSGILTYSPSEGLTLDLVGGFPTREWVQTSETAWAVADRGLKRFAVVHGTIGGQPATLLGVREVRTHLAGFGPFHPDVEEQELNAEALLLGVHTESASESTFVRASASIEDLSTWTSDYVISGEIGTTPDHKTLTGEATISVGPRMEPQSVDSDGVMFELSHWTTLASFDHYRWGTRGRIDDRIVISMSSTASLMSWNECHQHVRSIQDLVSLGTGRGASVIWLRLETPRPQLDAEESIHNRPGMVDVFADLRRSMDLDPHAPAVDTPVFTLDVLPFNELIPAWSNTRQQFRAACNLLLAPQRHDGEYLETQVITAVTAAESFHKQLGTDPPIPKDELDSLIDSAAKAVPAARSNWLRSVIPRGHSLRQRLEHLGDRLPQAVQSMLLPDPAEWVRKTVRARNELSHAGSSKSDLDELCAVLTVTRVVVLLNILIELGMGDESMVDLMTTNRRMGTAQRLSKKHLVQTKEC